jgi:DNA-binding NarL/FixJ family response regulator
MSKPGERSKNPHTRVLLADRHRLCHAGIETILKQTDDLIFSGVATSEGETLQLCRLYCPHLLLLAANVADDSITDFISTLQQEFPATKLLLLLADVEEMCLRTLRDNGVNGCIMKSESPERLPEVIRLIADGESWFSRPLLESLLNANNSEEPFPALTEQERLVLDMLVAGKKEKEIAEQLHMSERTLRRSLPAMYQKLGTENRTQAIYEAGRHNLLARPCA